MRYRALDGLRGLAALIVVLHHCTLTFPAVEEAPGSISWLLRASPLRLLVDGPAAVYLFFVLSGFVLSASIEAGLRAAPRFDYARFAAARILRLYPPYAAAVLASTALCLLIRPHPIPDLDDWFNLQSWAYPVTPALVAGELLMIDAHRYMTLLNPGWALIHILRISLLFPALFFALRARPAATLAIAAALGLAANFCASHAPLGPAAQTICGTTQYVFAFAAGGALYLARARAQALRRAGPWASLALFGAGLWLLLLPRTAPGSDVWLPGLGAIALTAGVLASAAADRALSAPPLLRLGEISFSLYLVHVVALVTVFHLFWGHAPAFVLLGLTVLVALAGAALIYAGVEQPCLALSRRIRARGAAPQPGRP